MFKRLMHSKEAVALLLVIGLAFLLRLYILTTSDNFQGSIPAGRVLSAMQILKDPSIKKNLDPSYAPFHLYLLAGTLAIWNNPSLAPRIISLALGVLLIIPFYYYVRVLSNEKIAFFSSVLVAIYPFHINQSTLSGPEVPFHFFLISSLCFFFYFKKDPNKKMIFLICSAIFLNFACMIRYEGWAFIPLLAIFLLNERIIHKVAFISTSLILPSFWMYLNYWGFGDPLKFLHHSDLSSIVEINQHRRAGEALATHYSSLFNKILCWPRILAETMPAVVVILGFFGLSYCLIKRKNLYLAAPFLALFFLFTHKVLNETWLVQHRYSLTLGLLLIPFVILGVDFIVGLLTPEKTGKVLIGLSVFVISYFSIQHTIATRPLVPQYVKRIGSWIRVHSSPQDRLLIDYDQWQLFHYNIILDSGLPPENCTMVPWQITKDRRVVDKTVLLDYLKAEKPKFILYCDRGYLPSFFGFSPTQKRQEERGDFTFRLVHHEKDPNEGFGSFYIYEASYKDLL